MQPRLPTSKKWTPMPADFAHTLIEAFGERFPAEAREGEFIAEGRIFPSEILLRVGYLEKGRLRQINFEASMEYSQEKKDAMDRLYRCVDAASGLLEEYFIARQEAQDALDEIAGRGGPGFADQDEIADALDFPTQWRPYEIEGEAVYLQSSTINSRLESEADRLLGEADAALVRDSQDSEDALERAVIDNELARDAQKAIRQSHGGH